MISSFSNYCFFLLLFPFDTCWVRGKFFLLTNEQNALNWEIEIEKKVLMKKLRKLCIFPRCWIIFLTKYVKMKKKRKFILLTWRLNFISFQLKINTHTHHTQNNKSNLKSYNKENQLNWKNKINWQTMMR